MSTPVRSRRRSARPVLRRAASRLAAPCGGCPSASNRADAAPVIPAGEDAPVQPRAPQPSSMPPVPSAGGHAAPTRVWLALLAVVAVGIGWLLARPFIHTLAVAIVVAALAAPLQERIARRVRQRDLAAASTILTLLLGVAAPLAVFVAALIPQARALARAAMAFYAASGNGAGNAPADAAPAAGVAAGGAASAAGSLPAPVELGLARLHELSVWVTQTLADFGIDASEFIDFDPASLRGTLLGAARQAGEAVLHGITAGVGNAVYLFGHFLLMLFILYFLLRDGRQMMAFVKRVSPLAHAQEDRLLSALRGVARSVFMGGVLVAVFQGVIGAVGFALVGLPALFWGFAMSFAAMIPVVGTALIWAPATAYLYLSGETWRAVFLLGWCAVLVSSSDGLLRAWFMKEGAGIPMVYLFLAILGGLNMFGILGLLYGPLLLTFAMVALTMYAEVAAEMAPKDGGPIR
ncbi:AI-2E family transporter [Nitratidesulfovibrio sp. D1]|uniref:AI-2E family transporter n=1 Tax=Nitratidesulfovibrio sp. D1 TaxID=3440151 RepID=UPI003EBC260E